MLKLAVASVVVAAVGDDGAAAVVVVAVVGWRIVVKERQGKVAVVLNAVDTFGLFASPCDCACDIVVGCIEFGCLMSDAGMRFRSGG